MLFAKVQGELYKNTTNTCTYFAQMEMACLANTAAQVQREMPGPPHNCAYLTQMQMSCRACAAAAVQGERRLPHEGTSHLHTPCTYANRIISTVHRSWIEPLRRKHYTSQVMHCELYCCHATRSPHIHGLSSLHKEKRISTTRFINFSAESETYTKMILSIQGKQIHSDTL